MWSMQHQTKSDWNGKVILMTPKKEAELIKKFPTVFADVTKPITESLMAFGCDVGDGWYWLVHDWAEILEEYNQLRRNSGMSPIKALQVKEKYGTLRLYTNIDTSLTNILESHFEEDSRNVCEDCGSRKAGWFSHEEKEDKTITTEGGWIRTLCKNCRERR